MFYDHPGRGFFQTSRVVVINRIVLLIIIIIIIIITSERFQRGSAFVQLAKKVAPARAELGAVWKRQKTKTKSHFLTTTTSSKKTAKRGLNFAH